MASVPIDDTANTEQEPQRERSEPRGGNERSRYEAQVEIEKQITQRRLIEAVTYVLVVVLYMVFALVRESDGAPVPLDPGDDWDES